MRDGALGVGSFEVKAEGSAVRGEAQAALQAGVRFHGGVARPELVCEPLHLILRLFFWAPESPEILN